MADRDDIDPELESGDPAVDPTGAQPHGSHALEPVEPAVGGVPAGADEPTFRDRERMLAEAEAEGDDSEPDDLSDGDVDAAAEDGDRELVAVGATASTREGGADVEPATRRGRQKKDKATPSQKQVAESERRTGPVKFLKESVSELQKVVYPTGQQLINYFIVVLIFVLFIIAIVSVLDLAFGKAIFAIFS